jgi:hypothetical protein
VEIFFVVLTLILSVASAALVFTQKMPAKIVTMCSFLLVWLVLWLFSLFFLPLASAQPLLYFKSELESAKAVTDQAEFFLTDGTFKDIVSIVSQVLGGIPLTLSSLWLPLTLLDGYVLLYLFFIAIFGTLLLIVSLFIKNWLASIAIIALNSLLIFMLLSIVPSIDQLGALDNSVINFALAVLGVTYGSAAVFILLMLLAFNIAHAWWLAAELSPSASASAASKVQKMQPMPSRFSFGASSAPKLGKHTPAKHSAAGVNNISALVALITGIALILSSLLLPLINYSREACAGNMTSLNSALSEMQRLASNLPTEVRSQLNFLPSAVNDPQELFPQAERKTLVRIICSEDVWTHSLWFLPNGGGAWTFALLLTLILGALLIFVGVTRTRAALVAIALCALTAMAILALVHALATIETFGYHDDFSLRVIGVLGATQPSLGVWIPLLISAIVLPIFLPFYVHQSDLLR